MSDLSAAFLAKTRQTNCTVWIGSTNNKGYGLIRRDGKLHLAHRVAYEAEFGPIPEGLVVDHLCRVRNCVNPVHLELVSVGENNRRGRDVRALSLGGTCQNGHRIDSDDDIYTAPRGTRECRECRRRSSDRTSGRRRPTIQRRADRVSVDLDQADSGAA